MMSIRCGQPCLQAAENTLLPCITAAVGEAMICEFETGDFLKLICSFDALLLVSCSFQLFDGSLFLLLMLVPVSSKLMISCRVEA